MRHQRHLPEQRHTLLVGGELPQERRNHRHFAPRQALWQVKASPFYAPDNTHEIKGGALADFAGYAYGHEVLRTESVMEDIEEAPQFRPLGVEREPGCFFY